MNKLKQCPFLITLAGTGLVLTILSFIGIHGIYASQEYDPLKEPVMAVMFRALNEGIYPWNLMDTQVLETVASVKEKEQSLKQQSAKNAGNSENAGDGQNAVPAVSSSPTPTATPRPSTSPSPSPTPTPSHKPEFGEGRQEPLRESTYDEYLNHISADIYGDEGEKEAAEYPFKTVPESYFDQTLFIGDSRTVGLRDYTELSGHADFLCETSLTIYKVMTENFKGMGTVENVIAKKKYDRIYLMVGINELGRGTTEDFMKEYTAVVDRLHELDPDAQIIIQAIMHVSAKKNTEDKIFNNTNIEARNHAIATLADNTQVFYIDMNEAVCDEDGNLIADYTFDQIHLLGKYNELWMQFLLNHGV